MNDTRRMLIAFLVVFVILFLWTTLTGRKKPEPVQIAQPPAAVAPQTPVPAVAPAPVPAVAMRPERVDTLENDVLRVVFSSYGGTIRSAWLKKYRVDLVPPGSRTAGVGLIGDRDYLDLSDRDMNVSRQDNTLEYVGLDSTGPTGFVRRYSLGDGYLLTAEVVPVQPNKGYMFLFGSGTALSEKNQAEDLTYVQLMTHGRKTDRYGAKQIKTGLHLSNRYRWVGSKSMYFLTAVSAGDSVLDTVIASNLPDRRIGWMAGTRGPRSDERFSIYFGPLEYNILGQSGLGDAFDFGKLLVIDLKWIGLPILKLLQWLFAIFRNYGVAIIFFALVIKLLFFPLSRVQAKQMKNMSLLQPKLNELKKRYKSDQEGLNRETMQLYKLYKVNPLSGCLPLLIQMPIFFAMYQVLRVSVDLRQASFAFWIRDLSLKDPYYVLPILMGVFSILQSLLTSAGQQNKALMFMMPIFITVIFLNFPSGLQLYWLIFNILSIVESLIVQGGIKWRRKPKQLEPAA